MSGCHLDLKLNNVTGMYSTYLTVKATRDFVKDNNHTHQLGFQPLPGFPHAMWENYTISPITIITTDKEHGSCNPWGDPHFTGFDLKKNYNVYEIGDFILYKSLNQKRPFEVQVRTGPCGGVQPCICAVIAREGNDVVEVDLCEKRPGVVEAPSVSFPTGHPLEGTTVSRDNKAGKIFYINFPSGTRIQVKTGIAHMDLDVQAPPDDFKAAEGLCGNWNGVEGGALRGGDGHLYTLTTVTNFTKSWQLPTGTSMFYQLPKYEQHLAPKFEYCSCNQGPVQCTKAGNGALNPNKVRKCVTLFILWSYTKGLIIDS
ncbi:von Willebrand factor D and EGF domain-containing protein [Magallana gigas]|uniref:von Willebrand factor D and EGF domain-containing protein n=1 Tax=Magallana gigas TaxID=29159 RepID=UPI00333FEF6C